jgi:hypothetical protein
LFVEKVKEKMIFLAFLIDVMPFAFYIKNPIKKYPT